jgi:hypothetical protein
MDDADLTTEREEKMMELLRRSAPKVELEVTGFCAYCNEPVQVPKKFCGIECSKDHEYEQARIRRNGRG